MVTTVAVEALRPNDYNPTAEDERLFSLLNDACMGARYDPDFAVTEDELRRLHRRVLLLEALTERLCRAKTAWL